MTGLDKIIEQIQQEGQQAAEKVLSDARAEAAKIAEAARADAEKQCAAIAAQSRQAVARQREAAESAAELRKRREVLAAKQELISAAIEDARSYVSALPDEEYFALILKMAAKYSLPQKGEILFSKRDLARLPKGFGEKIAATAAGPLTLSKETRPLDGGFVLSYGGIEENCSIEALLYAAREQLQDKVQELLFT